jgi:hypothetical protein
LSGVLKPAYYAYRLPIWISSSRVRRGRSLLVWGMLRMAPKFTAATALIRWRPLGGRRFQTISTVQVPASAAYGYFTTRVVVPGTGSVRLGWRNGTGTLFVGRVVGVTVGR